MTKTASSYVTPLPSYRSLAQPVIHAAWVFPWALIAMSWSAHARPGASCDTTTPQDQHPTPAIGNRGIGTISSNTSRRRIPSCTNGDMRAVCTFVPGNRQTVRVLPGPPSPPEQNLSCVQPPPNLFLLLPLRNQPFREPRKMVVDRVGALGRRRRRVHARPQRLLDCRAAPPVVARGRPAGCVGAERRVLVGGLWIVDCGLGFGVWGGRGQVGLGGGN